VVCDLCGRRVEPGDRFCTGCGAALDQPAAPVPADPSTDGSDEPADSGPVPPDADDATPEPSLVPVTAEPPPPPPAPAEPSTDPSMAAASTQPIPTADLPTTQPVAPVDTSATDESVAWDEIDPVWAATGSTPPTTADLPTTEPITEVWMESVDDATTAPEPEPVAEPDTGVVAATPPSTTAEMPAVLAPTPGARFRLDTTTLVSIGAGIVTLVSLFANVLSITSDARITPRDDMPLDFRTGDWIADDLADNLAIGGLIAAVLMVVGGVAAGFRWRWGSGLAGGAGLAFAGIAAVALGLAQIPIDAAHEMASIPSEEQFTLTITRDLGYWLLLAAGVAGVVLFFVSINDAFGDRRPGLNPWVAALGALAAVIAAAGPLLPENLAAFSDNWYVVDAAGEPPAMLLVGRLVQLGLVAFAGVVGFLSVRRWGLGLAIGGFLPAVWLATSTLFELTDRPVGPGFRNPGATDMHLHGVTIIGVSALAAMAVLAVVAAYDQSMRERR
jgi:hypothetical protein